MMDSAINQNRQLEVTDYVLASIFCVVFTIISVLFSTDVIHWFLFPLLPCGVLIGVDAVGWLRGKYDLFDPKGLLGLIGLHCFFTAQILVVSWDYHTSAVALELEDYRPWIGLLSIFNFLGLLLYRWVESATSRGFYNTQKARVWTPNDSWWLVILVFFIIMTFGAQAYDVFARGHIGTTQDLYMKEQQLAGGGIIRLLGGLGPLCLMILLTLIRNRRAMKSSSLIKVYCLFAFMLVVSLLSGGLVGSRGATVWKLFWIVGIGHFFWRRFSVKQALVGLVALVLFMQFYGIYKHRGLEGLKVFKQEGFAEATRESGTTSKVVLIGDLSRADVNAYMAYVLVDKPFDYEYRWGKTFWGDLLVQFPRWIYPNYYNLVGTSGKQRAGTDIMMGPSTFDASNMYSFSRYVYGLTGQVMLNFGILPIPFAFIILGYCVGRYRKAMIHWKPYDMRLFLAPIMIQLLIMLLTHDFNNLMFTVIFSLSLPLLIIRMISYRVPREIADEQESQWDDAYIENSSW